jgi:hypothetical protein
MNGLTLSRTQYMIDSNKEWYRNMDTINSTYETIVTQVAYRVILLLHFPALSCVINTARAPAENSG